MKDATKVIILAGGKGTRMGGDLPKVLVKLGGKPMVEHLLEAVKNSGVDEKPTIVVGYKKELVMETLGDKYNYVDQVEMLGTGHAVKSTKNYLKDQAKNIIILYGDHPFVSAETIKNINEKHVKSNKKITLATAKLVDFKDWRKNFKHFSRIIRNNEGKIIKDVQFKDATEEELKEQEINPCYYCFDADWLWSKLNMLDTKNNQKEYYLTDLIKIATEEDIEEIESIEIDPIEALGANSKEELETLEKLAPKSI